MTTKTRSPKPKLKTTRARPRKAIGVVEAGKAYNLDQFMRVMGCNWPTVRNMKRRGLKVRKDGGRVMILGQDYLDYLASLPPSKVSHAVASVTESQTASTASGGDDGSA